MKLLNGAINVAANAVSHDTGVIRNGKTSFLMLRKLCAEQYNFHFISR